MMRIDRDVMEDEGYVLTHDSRHYVTRLDPGQVRADQILAFARGHWRIENWLFLVNDRWWDEDRHWTRRPGVSDWFARLTRAATTVLRMALGDADPDHAGEPLRAKADRIAWTPLRELRITGLAEGTLQWSRVGDTHA